MLSSRLVVIVLTTAGLGGCSFIDPVTAESALRCADGSDRLLAGTVERAETATSFNDDIVFADDAHADISVRRYVGEDAGAPLVASTTLPITALPLSFEICGDADAVFGDDTEFRVDARVFNHAGTDGAVGDLVTEETLAIDGPTLDFTVPVLGLEECGTPASGGFCVDAE